MWGASCADGQRQEENILLRRLPEGMVEPAAPEKEQAEGGAMMETAEGANEKIIGTYCLCNTAAVCVHEIYDGSVLASINGNSPVLCPMTERQDDDGEWMDGFLFGGMFIPFSEVMRTGYPEI